jgi:hypothetical protein
MPLIVAGLQSDLESLFTNPPNNVAACAQQWANAIGAYASGIIPPSTTVTAAQAALQSALAGAFVSPAAAPVMDAAFTAFAAQVGLGMAPAFSGVPPVAPVGFATLFAPPNPQTKAEAAARFASTIDAWFHTGIATLVAPPNTPQPWA